MKAETITLIVAAWGAVLSTVAIGWNLYRDLSDRGKLRVACNMGSLVQQGVGIESENCLFWTVTNTGRRPVTLTKIGGRFKVEKYPYFIVDTHHPLPKTLQPGEYFIDYMDHYDKFKVDRLWQLTAHDSLGKTYKAPRKQVRKVKQELQEISSKSRGYQETKTGRR